MFPQAWRNCLPEEPGQFGPFRPTLGCRAVTCLSCLSLLQTLGMCLADLIGMKHHLVRGGPVKASETA